MDNVAKIVRIGLCVGCGTCVAVCPLKVVKIIKNETKGVYEPLISQGCNNCGFCVEACYGIGSGNGHIMKEGDEASIFGNYLNCFAGYACDPEIRQTSSSGGIITALSIYALEEGIVKGILAVRMNNKNPLEPRAFIARNKSDLLSASKSKYCPVPLGMSLEAIIHSDGRYGIVGLPCHIHGARKAEAIYTNLGTKISFHLGIFCGGTPNFLATEHLLTRLRVNKDEIERIEYRGNGWPGNMSIELKNSKTYKNRQLILPYPQYWEGIESLFFMHRCTLCDDGLNRLSDLSCGDAWLPEYKADNRGTSLIVTRTEVGEKLVTDACKKGYIRINKIAFDRVMKAQRSLIRFKTRTLVARIRVQKALGKTLPVGYDEYARKEEEQSPNLVDYILSIFFYLRRRFASKPQLWKLLDASLVAKRIKTARVPHVRRVDK